VCKELSIPSDRLSTNYQDFLGRVDGVDVVTPADSHLRICKECFEKGKDVFVEKPIALTSAEAKEMIFQADKRGLILQVGHLYRYHPASSKIRGFIEEGRLGKVQYAYGHFIGFKRPRTDVGVTQTDAIHYFDLFNYFFGGPPQAVRAMVRHYLNLPLDDTSFSTLEYGEKLVFIEAGYMSPENG
jgi:predicted dehydrogenase